MFSKLLKDFKKYDEARENVILTSREIIKLSKKIISSCHNGKIEDAENFKKEIEVEIKKIREYNNIKSAGSYTIAIQEYIEAILFLEFIKNDKLLEYSEELCSPDEYVLGLCDFVGELQRRSVLEIANGNIDEIKKNHALVREVYDGILDFNTRGDVRKKIDSIKYIMIKMEDIMMQLKLKK
ncbi:hypothetical protein KY321_00010 [Candidatus Woesearchaeota archaeon]|nr:hypothetical protein [Candidatus Woesearchaeota archaeon]